MKFPKLKGKDWVMVAIIVVAVAFVAYAIVRQRENLANREGFASQTALQAMMKKYPSVADPSVEGVAQIIYFAPVDDQLTILQKDLDAVRSGSWDIQTAASDANIDTASKAFPGIDPANFKQLTQAIRAKYPANAGPIADLFTKMFTIRAPAVAGPSPVSAPGPAMSAGSYSASCNKCAVVDNQISCACDVMPVAK